jgi:hypothetical protein
VIELLCYISPKQIPSTAWTDVPPLDIIGVTPHKITHRSFMRNFLFSINIPDFVYGVDQRTKPPMDTEHLSIDNRTKAHVIEDLGTIPPNIDGSVLT